METSDLDKLGLDARAMADGLTGRTCNPSVSSSGAVNTFGTVVSTGNTGTSCPVAVSVLGIFTCRTDTTVGGVDSLNVDITGTTGPTFSDHTGITNPSVDVHTVDSVDTATDTSGMAVETVDGIDWTTGATCPNTTVDGAEATGTEGPAIDVVES